MGNFAVSADAGAHLPAMTGEAHLAAFEEVCDSRDRFAVVFCRTAHGEDEVAEAVAVAGCFFQVLFHMESGRLLVVPNLLRKARARFPHRHN